MSDITRIRDYVMDIIYHAEGRETLIPSTPELALKFGIARSTIRQAVEKMADEELLIARRGIGTFTNPLKSFDLDGEKMLPLVGLKFYGGDHFYYDNLQLQKFGILAAALSRVKCNVRFLHATCATAEEFAYELEHARLDALVTVSVSPDFVRRAAETLPVLHIGQPVPGISGLALLPPGGVGEVEELLAPGGGRARLCYLESGSPPGQEELFDGFSRSARIDFRRVEIRGDRLMLIEALEKVLSGGCPEGFLLRGRWTDVLVRTLRKHGFEPGRDYRIINTDPSQADSAVPLYYYTHDWEAIAAALSGLLTRQLQGEAIGNGGEFKLILKQTKSA